MQRLRSFVGLIFICHSVVYLGTAKRHVVSTQKALEANRENTAAGNKNEPTVKFFKADAVEDVLPLAPKDYPEPLQGIIWMDQSGAYGYSDIDKGAPDAAVSFGDPANVLDRESKQINVDVSGGAWQWFNNFKGYAMWTLLHSIDFKYL